MPSEFALLARAPVPVTIGGREFQLPYRPAAEWAAGMERLDFLVAHLADVDVRDALVDLRIGQPSVRGELRTESLRILGEQTGRKWWEAGRLLTTSASPEVLGHLTLAGVDPWTVSVGQWCAAVYALCTKHADEKGRMKFDFQLAVPPPGYEDEWDDGADDSEQIAAAVAGLMG